MIQVDNCSTPELLSKGNDIFAALGRCIKARRRRDSASDMVTDLFLIIEAVARRLGAMEWNERVAAEDDEDEQEQQETRIEISLSEALCLSAQSDDEDEGREYTDLAEANARIRELEVHRLDIFRRIIRYTCHGCKTAEQVLKKWLALVRRVDPDSLRDIGMSQTAVARALGERRATTSAREMREFEAPMKRAGARGFHGSGGLRSDTNRDNCARAQRGNRNRSNGHARQSDQVSGIPETKRKRTNTKANP